MLKKHSKQTKFLVLILFFVAFDVLCDNYIAGSFGNESTFREILLFSGFLFLQIIFSPIQAGISDFYGRKISLIVSITFSLIGLIFVYLYDLQFLNYITLLCLLNLSKGVLGNTVPICWAAVGDLGNAEGKNLRFSFALATASYAIGYLILILLKKKFSDINATLLLSILFIFILIICIKYFFDLKDAKFKEVRRVKVIQFFALICREIIEDLKDKSIQMVLLTWISFEISIYIVLIYYADFSNYESFIIEILMMIGYLCGTYSVKFFPNVSDSKIVKVGYTISVVSLLPYFALSHFVNNIDAVLAACYFFHAIGNALLSPTMFSIISKLRKVHERGKTYGLAESADSIAFLISGSAIIVLKYYSLSIFYLICVSFIAALVTLIPFRQFEKLSAKRF